MRTLFILFTALGILAAATHAQSLSLESDARERARLEARRYEILRAHLDVRSLPEAAQAEIATLNKSLQVIDQRYRNATTTGAGGGLYQLQNRTRELVAAEVGPSWNRLMLSRFPLPEQIRRDFNDDARYAAALIVVGYEFTLGRTLRPPRTPELDARDALYNQATEVAMAPYKAKGEQSREWRMFERDMLASSQSAAFKREVLGRYVPLFAGFVRDDPSPSSVRPALSPAAEWLFEPVWGDEFSDTMVVRGQVLIPVVLGLLLAGFLVAPLWLSRRRGRRHNAPSERQPLVSPLALPVDQQVPALPAGLRPDMFVEHARVLDLQTWSETKVSWQSSSGNSHVAPGVSVQTSTVQKDRLWVQNLDGLEQAWTITEGVFEANRGHLLTWVNARMRPEGIAHFLVFNHNTQQWYEHDWVKDYHGGFWTHWFLLNLLWLVPGCGALYWMMRVMEGPEGMVSSLLVALVVSSLVWVGIAHWWIARRRRLTWQRRYRPQLLEWLKGLSLGLNSTARSAFTRAE